MRELVYVPVIHLEADLGNIATVINKRSIEVCGERRWKKHKQTVALFWDSISNFFSSIEATNIKIYQDGLMASGKLGRKIVEEGARRGSKNYELVLDLVKRGGEIRKTEDVDLLRQEYEETIKLAQTKSVFEKSLAYIGYKLHKSQLMKKRDEFIAKNINETLRERETGVLFIGAYHDVIPLLSKDIIVKKVKSQEKIKEYFKELTYGRDQEKFDKLAKYLASPIQNL